MALSEGKGFVGYNESVRSDGVIVGRGKLTTLAFYTHFQVLKARLGLS